MIDRISSARVITAAIVLLPLTAFGCDGEARGPQDGAGKQLAQPSNAAQAAGEKADGAANAGKDAPQAPDAKRAALGKSVWIETRGDKRRVLVGATVCLREGNYGLECLLCRNRTKEHESILTTDADAKVIHLALIAAGGVPGSPIRYVKKDGKDAIAPPTGSRIKVSLQYEVKGKSISVPAQQWVRNGKTKRDLDEQWVFAGSEFWPNEQDGKQGPLYAATEDGAYICISNVPTALLDLPINSPKSLEEREFEPHTERIPALQTKVLVILEPQADAKTPTK